jgi:hypothetical protein
MLRIDRGDTKWMERADCSPDRFGRHMDWTPDRVPTARTMQELSLVCYECPVRRECAGYAIDAKLDNGVYAGIYVPTKLNEHQRRTLGFSAAMNQLASIAGRKPVFQRCKGVHL